MTPSKEHIIALAAQAGFDTIGEMKMCGMSGQTDDDELAYVHAYPIGEKLLKFAELLAAQIDS